MYTEILNGTIVDVNSTSLTKAYVWRQINVNTKQESDIQVSLEPKIQSALCHFSFDKRQPKRMMRIEANGVTHYFITSLKNEQFEQFVRYFDLQNNPVTDDQVNWSTEFGVVWSSSVATIDALYSQISFERNRLSMLLN